MGIRTATALLFLTAGLGAQDAMLGVQASPSEDGSGAVIVSVLPGTAAEILGIEVGDRILAVGDDATPDAQALAAAIGRRAAGDIVVLKLVRDGETVTRKGILGRRAEGQLRQLPGAAPERPARPLPPARPDRPSPPRPARPALPATPGTPSVPQVPPIPALPTLPALPALPAMPAPPAIPAIPALPAMPTAPELRGDDWEAWARDWETWGQEWETWAEQWSGEWEPWAQQWSGEWQPWAEQWAGEWEPWAEEFSKQWEPWAESWEPWADSWEGWAGDWEKWAEQFEGEIPEGGWEFHFEAPDLPDGNVVPPGGFHFRLPQRGSGEAETSVYLRYPGSTPEPEREKLLEEAREKWGADAEIRIEFHGEGTEMRVQKSTSVGTSSARTDRSKHEV